MTLHRSTAQPSKHYQVALAVGLLSAVLSGCTATPDLPGTVEPAPDTQPVPEDQSETSAADDATTQPRTSSGQNATLALVQQSQRAEAAGSLSEAVAYAERAIRIDPRAPDLWLRLAELELRNNAPESTIQYANKALSLIQTRADWQRQAWLLIADAHEVLGEQAKADAIRARWRTYRG